MEIFRELESEIIDLYVNSTMLVREIAAKYGYSQGDICRLIDRRGIPKRGRKEFKPTVLSEDQKQLVINLYHKNQSVRFISQQIKIDGGIIRRFLKSRGLDPSRKNVRYKYVRNGIKDEDVIEEFKKSGKISPVCRVFEINATTVKGILERAGIKWEWDGNFLKILEENREIIIKRHFSGEPYSYIAKDFGVAGMTIKKKIISWGLVPEKPPKKKKLEALGILDSDVIEKYKEFGNLTITATHFKVSVPIIRDVLRRNDIEIKVILTKVSPFTDEIIKYVIRRYSEGAGCPTIAPEIGFDKATVLNILKRAGIERSYKIRARNKKILEENKENIYRWYFVDNLSIPEISEMIDVGIHPIYKIFEEWKFETRDSRYRESSLERKFKLILSELFIDYEQYLVVGKRVFDFYLPKYNLIIETNGDYWHGNPNKYPFEDLNDEQKAARKRDLVKFKLAKKKGYDILFLWEIEIKEKEDFIRKILKELEYKIISQEHPADFVTEKL